MINIEAAKGVFKKYVSNYNMENSKVNLKYYHTLRVADIAKRIAMSLDLDEEHVALAELIGLLHDIARFEQVRIYDSFNDLKTIDHGDLGVEILFDNNMIRDFVKEKKYDRIIKAAVYTHNKATIPDNYNDEEQLYSKIVRDADKLDILYLDSINDIRFNIGDEAISKVVLDSFMSKSFIHRQDTKTGLDEVLLNLAFIFDLNFPYSYEILREENYLGVILDSLDIQKSETKKIFNNIKHFINKDFNIIKEVI